MTSHSPAAPVAAVPAAAHLAAAGALLTLALITIGGLVTNTDSGLACPDWPTCFGTPFPKLVGGVLMEHGHRYLATAVGFVAALGVLLVARGGARWVALAVSMPLILGAGTWAGIARHRTGAVPLLAALLVLAGYLAGIAAAARSRGSSRLAQVALLLVITQGLLGGLTVMYQLPVTVLVLHTGTSMIFLSAQLWLWLRLRREGEPAGQGAGFGALLAAQGAGRLPLLAAATSAKLRCTRCRCTAGCTPVGQSAPLHQGRSVQISPAPVWRTAAPSRIWR
jgi:heme A synthase